jgi:hypothetical protein
MINSVLAVECGSIATTAVLIEQTEGAYAIRATGQAPSTYGPPWDDITLGVQEAIHHIEKIIGRTLLAPGGWPITPQNIQQGVDAFTVISSAGQPLQVVVAGLMQNITLASALRAAATTYTHVTKVVSLDGTQGSEARVQAIQEGQPEVILLVGGTDGGAELPVIELAQVISMTVRLLKNSEMPTVLYAGNIKLRTEMADILGPVAALRSVNNVRPRLDIEDLIEAQVELEHLYLQKKMAKVPGFDKLSNWTKYPVMPVSRSFEKLVGYIGQHNYLNVIGVNIGSRSTTVATQLRDQSPASITRSDVGVGHSLAALLKLVPIEKFHRWLPFELPPEDLYDQLLNKSLYPTTIPTSFEDLMIEQAVAREALGLVVDQAVRGISNPQWNLAIGAGRLLTGSPQAAQAALVMIDGIEPCGVTSLAIDKNGLLNMLGAIAVVEPIAAVKIAAQDAFLNLGTVVAPIGHGAPGKPALKIKLDYGEGEIYEKEVPYGAIEMIDLPLGKTAKLEVRPARHFDIGLGQPGRGAIAEVEGGVLGIIVDTRGRPLRLPKDDLARQEQLQQWLSTLDIPYAAPENND